LTVSCEVLYGDDRPFFGFEKVTPEVFSGDKDLEAVSLVYRRGVKSKLLTNCWLKYYLTKIFHRGPKG
jgi:hypothetical protein